MMSAEVLGTHVPGRLVWAEAKDREFCLGFGLTNLSDPLADEASVFIWKIQGVADWQVPAEPWDKGHPKVSAFEALNSTAAGQLSQLP